MTGGTTYDQRRLVGRALRSRVPRSAHKAWRPPVDRPDPVDLLEENNRPRLPDLVPVRYGRMLASRFAFLRGSAVIMASDLASTPVTGFRVQACGDAHLGNFGVFGTPERNLIFDVNDFDETLPGPWEWDVKRLAVSVIVAAGDLRLEAERAAGIAAATVRAYRERMAELARVAPLDVWYDRIDVATVLAIARQRRARELERQLSEARLRQRTSLRVLPKLTSVVNGTRKIIDDPPLIGHFDPEAFDGEKLIEAYAASLPPDRQPLLRRYRVLDTARKVVGVGSVGTRCYLSLLTDADARSPIFLQLKEANQAVLAPYAGQSEFAHQGQRVVVGQRLMQAASDMFLGWTSYRGHDYYVRQFRDMKGSVNLDAITPGGFESYAEVCGRTLARTHARSGDAAAIAGYAGAGTRFDECITAFARAYGEQVRRDYDALVAAVSSGRVTAAAGLPGSSDPADARGAERQVVLLDRPDQGARRPDRLDPDRGGLAAAGRQRLVAVPHGLADRMAAVPVDQQQRAAEPSGFGQPRHHGGAEPLHRVLDPPGVHVHPGQPEPRRSVQRRLPLVDRNPVALDAHRAHGPAHHVGAPGRGHLLGMDQRLARRPERLEYRHADLGVGVQRQPQAAVHALDRRADRGLDVADRARHPVRVGGDQVHAGSHHLRSAA